MYKYIGHFQQILTDKFIITEDLEGEESIGDKKIEYIPLWKWLLRSKPSDIEEP